MSTAPIAQGPVDVNVRGWTSVCAALPIDGQRVLCWEDFTSIGKKWQGAEVFYYRAGIGFVNLPDDDDAYGCITHWMLLPDAPNV